MEQEYIVLLKSAVGEIEGLRNENKFMAARLQVFDSMMMIFHASPNYNNTAMSPNLVWEINKFIESNK